jgi:proteic killer suppression protein
LQEDSTFFHGEHVPAFSGFSRQATKRLRVLDASDSIAVLKALPSNRFEMLAGDRVRQCSIRINRQWRICVTWKSGTANVEIVDYH